MSYVVDYPNAEHHEIISGLHVGGHMWQVDGRYQDGRHSTVSQDESWGYVVSAYMDPDNKETFPKCDIRFVFFNDTETGLSDETWAEIKSAVDSAVFHWNLGSKVLVRCQAGFNRSGLIGALILMRLGFTADLAIKTLRERRSSHVLINPVFESYVREREEEYRSDNVSQRAYWPDEKIDRLIKDIFEEE